MCSSLLSCCSDPRSQSEDAAYISLASWVGLRTEPPTLGMPDEQEAKVWNVNRGDYRVVLKPGCILVFFYLLRWISCRQQYITISWCRLISDTRRSFQMWFDVLADSQILGASPGLDPFAYLLAIGRVNHSWWPGVSLDMWLDAVTFFFVLYAFRSPSSLSVIFVCVCVCVRVLKECIG